MFVCTMHCTMYISLPDYLLHNLYRSFNTLFFSSYLEISVLYHLYRIDNIRSKLIFFFLFCSFTIFHKINHIMVVLNCWTASRLKINRDRPSIIFKYRYKSGRGSKKFCLFHIVIKWFTCIADHTFLRCDKNNLMSRLVSWLQSIYCKTLKIYFYLVFKIHTCNFKVARNTEVLQ